MTSIILVIAGALFTFLGQDVLSPSKWPLAACLIVLGVFGAVFSVKQYERARRHMTIAGKHRRVLEAEVGLDLSAIKKAADADHKRKFPSISCVRLNVLWTAIHFLIAAAGVVLLFVTLITKVIEVMRRIADCFAF